MDTLVEQFGLKQTGRFRGVVNADDVLQDAVYSCDKDEPPGAYDPHERRSAKVTQA
jgi:hypothetical protein